MIDLLFGYGKSFTCNSVHDINEIGDLSNVFKTFTTAESEAHSDSIILPSMQFLTPPGGGRVSSICDNLASF